MNGYFFASILVVCIAALILFSMWNRGEEDARAAEAGLQQCLVRGHVLWQREC